MHTSSPSLSRLYPSVWCVYLHIKVTFVTPASLIYLNAFLCFRPSGVARWNYRPNLGRSSEGPTDTALVRSLPHLLPIAPLILCHTVLRLALYSLISPETGKWRHWCANVQASWHENQRGCGSIWGLDANK